MMKAKARIPCLLSTCLLSYKEYNWPQTSYTTDPLCVQCCVSVFLQWSVYCHPVLGATLGHCGQAIPVALLGDIWLLSLRISSLLWALPVKSCCWIHVWSLCIKAINWVWCSAFDQSVIKNWYPPHTSGHKAPPKLCAWCEITSVLITCQLQINFPRSMYKLCFHRTNAHTNSSTLCFSVNFLRPFWPEIQPKISAISSHMWPGITWRECPQLPAGGIYGL